jgi:hypothetical protein
MDNFENRGFFRRNAVWVVVIAVLAIFGFLLYKGWGSALDNGIDETVTITGHFSCLPLREGIVHDENACFLGIRSRDGAHYALDITRIQDANTDLVVEDTIAVTGFLKPESIIASSAWADFDIKAIIQVNTLLRTR